MAPTAAMRMRVAFAAAEDAPVFEEAAGFGFGGGIGGVGVAGIGIGGRECALVPAGGRGGEKFAGLLGGSGSWCMGNQRLWSRGVRGALR